MVPEGWIPSQIGDIAKFSSGGTPSKQKVEYWGGSEPWISGKDLKTHYLTKSIDTLTEEGFKSAKKAPKGASLILVRGMTLLKDFPVGYATRDVAFNQDLKALVPTSKVDGLFLSFLLVAEKHKIRQLVSNAGHGTGRLDTQSIQEYPVNLPPLPEQKKIAQVLSTWDAAITTTEQLLANSQQQKKALMQQLLTGKNRLLDKNGVKFSGEWAWLKASDVFKTVSKKNNSDKEELLAVTQDQGVLPRSLLERRVVMPDGSTRGYKLVVPGNFIISLRSFQGGLEYSNYRGLVSPAYTVLEAIIEIDDEFYKQYYKSYDFIGHLAVAVIGIRDGKQISYSDFSFLKLPHPNLEEQKKIAAVLSKSDREIDTLRERLEVLKREKSALMQQLLTGKRRTIV